MWSDGLNERVETYRRGRDASDTAGHDRRWHGQVYLHNIEAVS